MLDMRIEQYKRIGLIYLATLGGLVCIGVLFTVVALALTVAYWTLQTMINTFHQFTLTWTQADPSIRLFCVVLVCIALPFVARVARRIK